MRKSLVVVLVVLLALGAFSVIQAQSWVPIPMDVLRFDTTTSGQELGHFDDIGPYVQGDACIKVSFHLGNPVPYELMFAFNQGVDIRFGFDLASGYGEGDHTRQFSVSEMQRIDKGSGEFVSGHPDLSKPFDYMVIRRWDKGPAEVYSVAVNNDMQGCKTAPPATAVPSDNGGKQQEASPAAPVGTKLCVQSAFNLYSSGEDEYADFKGDLSDDKYPEIKVIVEGKKYPVGTKLDAYYKEGNFTRIYISTVMGWSHSPTDFWVVTVC